MKSLDNKNITQKAAPSQHAVASSTHTPIEEQALSAARLNGELIHPIFTGLKRPIAKKAQQILLDARGYILESSDTIFSTDLLRHQPATKWSTFLASIYEQVVLLTLDSAEIRFPYVETIADFLKGQLFDCSFMRVELGDNDQIFVWTIFDYPKNALFFIQEQQQKRNKLYL